MNNSNSYSLPPLDSNTSAKRLPKTNTFVIKPEAIRKPNDDLVPSQTYSRAQSKTIMSSIQEQSPLINLNRKHTIADTKTLTSYVFDNNNRNKNQSQISQKISHAQGRLNNINS